MPWYTRLTRPFRAAGSWMQRVVASGAAALRSPPARPGIATGRVAANPNAEKDLFAMAESPTVYAAVLRRALEFATHPVVVYRGWSMGGGGLQPVVSSPWVEALYRLLATPDPASVEEIAPEPGEGLISQIVADLLLVGVFAVAPTVGDSGAIIGLTRLHPGCCAVERVNGREELVYRNGSEVRRYARRSVFVGRLLSWAKDGRQEFGIGAGTPLGPLVRAEATALRHTADKIEQGGADLVLRGATATGKQMLANPETRKTLVETVVNLIRGPGGRRVMAMSADIEVNELGVKPADLQAPELLAAAKGAELMAIGCVPAWVGAEAGTYATAVIQLRVQAGNDEAVATVIEAYFLRPLARHFARRAGGMDARRFEQITARVDLSQHPGYMQLLTDRLTQARTMVHDLGYTAEQAIAALHLDLPKPAGQILSRGAPSADQTKPGPDEGSHRPDPRDPVGDNGDENTTNPPERAAELRLIDLFPEDSEMKRKSA